METFRMILVYLVVMVVGLGGFFSIPLDILANLMVAISTITVAYFLILLSEYVYERLYGDEE